jgi:hypothetical protein
MSIRDVCSNLRSYTDELEAAVSGSCSDEDFQYAMKRFIMSTYSSLASLSFYGGASDAGMQTIQGEAVPASEIIDSAFYDENREREFDLPSYTPQRSHGTYNSMQQFGSTVEGARL